MDETVTLAGAEYRLTDPVRLSVALDLLPMVQGSQGDQMRAGAVALAVQCPRLLPRLGLTPYGGNAWEYGGRVIDALTEPSARQGKASQSSHRATLSEVTAACGVAIRAVYTVIAGCSEQEVEDAAGPTDAIP